MQKGSNISTGIDKTAIRDAATVIVVRDKSSAPKILMGQRGAKAAFMPSKFVFPGGAVDAGDSAIPLASPLPHPCNERLAEETGADTARALPIAAIRELWEETGQILGTAGDWSGDVPEDWQGFAARGFLPAADAMEFVFRAITPPGRPRRFDARFFLIDADALVTDPDDFSAASDELSHLQWIPLPEVRQFDLPFITEVVLAEIAARLRDGTKPDSVPFYKDRDEDIHFARLGGDSPLN